MPNVKTEINHNLSTQTTEKSQRMEYSEKTVKFIARVIEDLRNNTTEKRRKICTKVFTANRI